MGGEAKKKHRELTACAYCAELGTNREIEHVFPESWHPDEITNDRMVRVPSCSVCNRRYGQAEERLMAQFVVSLPPAPRTASLFERVVRGMDPTQGTSVRDVAYRQKRKDDFFRRTNIVGPLDQPENALWSPAGREIGTMTTPAGLIVQGTPTVRFRPADLRTFTIKLLRGCYYAESGRPLPPKVPCGSTPFTTNPESIIERAQSVPGARVKGEWPFQYLVNQGTNDPTLTLWFFSLWDHYVLSAWSNITMPTPSVALDGP
jgi:hypothetical protein